MIMLHDHSIDIAIKDALIEADNNGMLYVVEEITGMDVVVLRGIMHSEGELTMDDRERFSYLLEVMK